MVADTSVETLIRLGVGPMARLWSLQAIIAVIHCSRKKSTVDEGLFPTRCHAADIKVRGVVIEQIIARTDATCSGTSSLPAAARGGLPDGDTCRTSP